MIEIDENVVFTIYHDYMFYKPDVDINEPQHIVRSDWGVRLRGERTGVSALHDPDPHFAALHAITEKETQFDLAFLRMADIWRMNSHAVRKKVACLIVRDYSIISDGYNGTPAGFHTNKCEDEDGETMWYVLHAEANAITKLARRGVSSDGATIYCTFSPCRECCKLILQAGIKRLVYSEQHSDMSGMVFLAQNGVKISSYNLRNEHDRQEP